MVFAIYLRYLVNLINFSSAYGQYATTSSIERMQESATLRMSRKVLQNSKILGFSPITIVEGKSTTKIFDIVLFLSNIAFGIFICVFSIQNRSELMTSQSKIANLGNFAAQISSVVIAITLMVSSFICRHRTWTSVLVLDKIDRKVKTKD